MVDKHISVTFGRMNPVTTGHAKLINTIQAHAAKTGGEHKVFVSSTHDAKKNPLSHSQKVGFIKKMIPTADVHDKDNVKTPIDMLKHLHKKGYSHVHMFVGDDRKQEMSNLVHHYNGKDYNFKHIEVHSAGARDPDSEGVEGMSASKMRDAAKAKDFKHFSKGVPNSAHAKELYHAVRKGMKLESVITEENNDKEDEAIHNMSGREASNHITRAQFKTIGKHDSFKYRFNSSDPHNQTTWGIEHRQYRVNVIHANNKEYHAQFTVNRHGKYYGHSLWATDGKGHAPYTQDWAKGLKHIKNHSIDEHKALFVVGGPGSGKDFMVKGILTEQSIMELPLDKLYKAILAKANIIELNEGRNVIVNGNADNLEVVTVCKAVLEAMGYDTAMTYVYTTNEESKARNDIRAFRGAKTISEETRFTKYLASVKNLDEFKNMFEDFFQHDNSTNFDNLNDDAKNDICHNLVNMTREIATFFEGKQKAFPKRHDAPKVAATSEPKGEPIIKGYERVKQGSFWVIRPKGGIQREEADLSAMFENYSSSANDDSKGNTGQMATNSPTENPQTVIAKVQSKKKTKKISGIKGAPQAPDYFDQRLGAVPSGGIGLTSSYEPKKGKTINEIRGLIK